MIEKLSDEELIEYYELMKNLSKRNFEVKTKGEDTKFLYHVVRLLDEVEQILQHGTIDLQRNREQLKAIRRGDVSEEDVIRWASEKELELEKLYHTSKLRHNPEEEKIKQLLLDCLEHHYGSLEQAVTEPKKSDLIIDQIVALLHKEGKM